jgi:Membrane-associated phospholipid phosphatase
MNTLISLDWSILNSIQTNCRTTFFDKLMPVVTNLGGIWSIWILITIILLITRKYRKVGVTLLFGLAMEVLVCNVMLKPLIARIRPCDVNTAVQLLVSRPTDFSFPSGHSASSFAAASVLLFEKHPLRIPAFVFAIAIAFSRLYLYVHFPSDVLAGALLGIMLGYLAHLIVTSLYKAHISHI